MIELRRYKASVQISAECMQRAYDPGALVRSAAADLMKRFPDGYLSFHVRPVDENGSVVAIVFIVTGMLPIQH